MKKRLGKEKGVEKKIKGNESERKGEKQERKNRPGIGK